MKKVIIVSAHPDDETLGAGGTLLKHLEEGDELYWLIVTAADESLGFTADWIEKRKNEIITVSNLFNFRKVFELNYQTMSLSSRSLIELIPEISEIFKEIEPEIVYTLNRSDAHSDHRYLAEAVLACTKSFRYPFIKKVLMYECLSETEFAPPFLERVFIPNYFVDISDYLDKKIEIMKIFKSEIDSPPFPRSEENIRALARFRGSTMNCQFAEAFQVVKILA